ncbi:MAG: hypothetical protein JNK54_03860 [Elusimicrobia bacterium]|nr:hypothetical protein [Elusimicrobiota bacterium]
MALLGLTTTLFTPTLSLHADDSFDDTDYMAVLEERERGVGWNLAIGPTGGHTTLLGGYKDYGNLGNVGLDIYFRPPVPQFPRWYDRLLFRLSGSYYPLEVPPYVAYTTEDLYSVNATVIFRLMGFYGTPEHKRLIPFIGAGPALQWDRVSIKHPAVQESGANMHLGFSATGGFMLPTVAGFRLIPEVRYQAVREPDQYWTSHISYMLALTYWPPANVVE